jgi:dTDP-4-amino-4,6-dideoxygalactose transaminase
VYHLFVVRSAARDALRSHLADRGIETVIHYPIPIPAQPALASVAPAECVIASRACASILSLPLHPALQDHELATITTAIASFDRRTVAGRIP